MNTNNTAHSAINTSFDDVIAVRARSDAYWRAARTAGILLFIFTACMVAFLYADIAIALFVAGALSIPLGFICGQLDKADQGRMIAAIEEKEKARLAKKLEEVR